MNEVEKTENTGKTQDDPNLTIDSVDEPGPESRPADAGLPEWLRKLLSAPPRRRAGTKQESAKNRKHPLALMIVGIVSAVLCLIALFSTPAMNPIWERSGRNAPNLGRPITPNQTTETQGSVTPLLNADVGSNQKSSDQLSPADIRGTSPRAAESDEIRLSGETQNVIASPRARNPQPGSAGTNRSSSGADSDPSAERRPDNNARTPAYTYGGAPVSFDRPVNDSFDRLGSVAREPRPEAPGSKTSIVFVRTRDSSEAAVRPRPLAASPLETSLLPPGTRLMARLEAAATTAVKTPVVASIEYNYERAGMIVVPAGSTAIGDVQQASPEGYLNIRFHTLRMPDGREEKVEGSGLALDHRPLKGEVAGKNTGKKILSRTLSGVGTIAAYVVGAGGAGLNRNITGETLLRDRLASNIATAGDRELMNAAYSQSISVTVPANTRFYVVLQKAAVNTAVIAPSRMAESATQPAGMPSVQELRELMDLRREINRMYQESNGVSNGGTKP